MVSIIIPNYNHSDYLMHRIDSVLNQSYTDFEVILLDDCSTDRSIDILLSYKDHPKVSQVVLNAKNSGSTFKQWSRGFELADGDFIWIAESDDWCEPTLLETLIKPLLTNETIVLSYCQTILVNEEGEILYRTENNRTEQTISGFEFVNSRMFGDTVLVNAGMVVFRKSALMQIDNKYKNMKSAGDWMFWVQIALQGNIFISFKTLNYCFRHTDTVTSRAEISGQDIQEGNLVFKYIIENVNPSVNDIRLAIKQRFNSYFNQKKRYMSIEVQRSSLKKILSLHDEAKNIYRKICIKRIIYALFNTIKKAIKR